MLAVRALTAAALLAVFVAAALFLDRTVFSILVGLIVALAAREWAALAGLGGVHRDAYAAGCTLLYAGIAWWSWPVAASAAPTREILIVAFIFWGAAVPLWLARAASAHSRRWMPPAGVAVLLPAALATIALPRTLLLAVLGLVWTADTAAYLAGRSFGRHRLAPVLSPGKTWEGVAGALVASVAYAVILAVMMPRDGAPVGDLRWLAYSASALLLCGAGVLGDLFESAVKRQAGVKDSGRLLPGHGGVLDRIDSATAVLPLGALLFVWFEAA